MIILLGLVRLVNFLIDLGLFIRVAFMFHASTLEMWSTPFEIWPWFFCGFYFVYWYFWGMKISSKVPLGSLVFSTESTYVVEAIFHDSQVGMCPTTSLNLWTEVRGDPSIFENAMCKMFCTEICVTFSTNAIQDSTLPLVPLNVSMEKNQCLNDRLLCHH